MELLPLEQISSLACQALTKYGAASLSIPSYLHVYNLIVTKFYYILLAQNEPAGQFGNSPAQYFRGQPMHFAYLHRDRPGPIHGALYT